MIEFNLSIFDLCVGQIINLFPLHLHTHNSIFKKVIIFSGTKFKNFASQFYTRPTSAKIVVYMVRMVYFLTEMHANEENILFQKKKLK